MRKWTIAILSLMMLVMLPLTAAVGLAALAPFQPGQALFGLQNAAEHVMLSLTPDAAGRANDAIDLVLRRVDDLQAAQGDKAILAALGALQSELDRALPLIAAAPLAETEALRARLENALLAIQQATKALQLSANNSLPGVVAFMKWVVSLEEVALDPDRPLSDLLALSAATQDGMVFKPAVFKSDVPTHLPNAPTVSPHIVVFPPGSVGAQHGFFPLTGKHSSIACTDCHVTGRFAGTARSCAECHATARPVDHFPGECKLCHSTEAWTPATFDHAVVDVSNCETCHQSARPADHWTGRCVTCHSTNAWKPSIFSHSSAAAADCASCHASRKPANHYPGQCGACHSTNAWKPATFNHQVAGATNCASCHANRKPANHYSGQCGACHSTNAWRPATFNHAAAGATNCVGCHAGNRPANHFDGQCSDCHSTNTWAGATFNHSFPTNHGGANNQCANCHPSGYGSYTCTTCHSQAKLDDKHSNIPNYASRCMDCHAGGGGGGD